MIEKHQILIDGLVKISQMDSFHLLNADDMATDTLKTYMGANNLELDERSFLPGFHEYITAYSYDINFGYQFIQYSIPVNVWPKSKPIFIHEKYKLTHAITSILNTETHLIISIDIL